MYECELWLTATAVELVGVETVAFDEAAHARLLVARLAQMLTPADVAVLVADEGGRLTIAAANTHRARDLLALESRFDSGPCTACYRSGKSVHTQPVVVPDRDDSGFDAAAAHLDYRQCSTIPMGRHGETVGAVCVLRDDDAVADEPLFELAQLLVDAAAIGLIQQRALRLTMATSEQLQSALDSRVLIEQAKGVLAAKLDTTPQTAFDVLRGYARRNNQQLLQVARKVVHGDLSDRDLTSERRRP